MEKSVILGTHEGLLENNDLYREMYGYEKEGDLV